MVKYSLQSGPLSILLADARCCGSGQSIRDHISRYPRPASCNTSVCKKVALEYRLAHTFNVPHLTSREVSMAVKMPGCPSSMLSAKSISNGPRTSSIVENTSVNESDVSNNRYPNASSSNTTPEENISTAPVCSKP